MPTSTDVTATMGYLARALKTPTIGRVWEQLAATARDEGWSHEEYLAAVLQRQVADREANGTSLRIAGAHFPQIKTLEDFNTDHQPSLRRDVLAHLATTTWIPKAENVILLGPPGVGKTHCETPDGGLTGLLGAGVPESVPAAATDSKVSLTRWRHAAVSLLWICRRGRRHRPDPPSLA